MSTLLGALLTLVRDLTKPGTPATCPDCVHGHTLRPATLDEASS